MPLQNRVTPLGELIATPARGLVYGNRGCLHDRDGRICRRHDGKRWIACRLEFRGWQRSGLLMPGRFTELFFLDEATALAAGHRPCALCRRADYKHLQAAWAQPTGAADAIDARLHGERINLRTGDRRLHAMPIAGLPDGAFVMHVERPWLVLGSELLEWSAAGYATRVRRPARGMALVVTPPSLVGILRTERTPLVPLLHPSAL